MQFKEVNDEVTELIIYGDIREIGMFERMIAKDWEENPDGVSSLTFREALEEVKTEKLLVRINSYGGLVSEGLAIYNQLNDFKGHLITKVDGFAASAASIIFMAGKERIAPTASLLMIHNAWARAEGNSKELRKVADDLEKITQPSIDVYVEKTGQKEELIKQMMDGETWITSKEALELGFATKEVKETEEPEFQQHALLSLVRDNKNLKQELEKLNLEISELKENDESETSTWDGFF